MSGSKGIPSQPGTAAAPGGRNALLDGLRFLAALLIVIYHYSSEGPRPLEQMSPIFLRGYLSTDFFLMLSGYVLGRAYGGKIAAGAISDEAFLVKRLLRVWPAHLVMLAAFAAVIGAATLAGLTPNHADFYRWNDLAAQAALVHAWGFGPGTGWNLPTWSLSALIVCYAAFPTLWRKLGRVEGAALLFAAGLGLIHSCDLGTRAALGHGLYDLPFHLGVIRALPLFVFGLLIARAGELGWPSRAWAGWIAAGAGVALLGLQAFGRFDLASIALLGLLIAAGGQVRLARGAKLFGQAAQISFALYITHIFTGMIWFNLVRAAGHRLALSEPLQWALWAMAFPAAVIVAALFDKLVDQPLQAGVASALKWRRARYPARAPSGSAPPR
jgi:peptidoglycan/LPS O-acetylase OafA/YrhL